MNESSNRIEGTAEIRLSDVAGFLAKAWKSMLVGALLGGLLAAAYIGAVPRKYTATASIAMAVVPRGGPGGSYSAEAVETPRVLAARMRSAPAHHSQVAGSCGGQGASVAFNPGPEKDMLSLTVRAPGSDVAKGCVDAIFHLIRSEQAAQSKPLMGRVNRNLQDLQARMAEGRAALSRFEKSGIGPIAYLAQRDEIQYLHRRLDEAQAALDLQADTRLVGAVDAPSQPAFPRRPFLLALIGVLAGMLGGFIFAGLRRQA